MATILERVTVDALQLVEKDRIKLANALLGSLEQGSSGKIATAWEETIARRIGEIDDGNAKGRLWADIKRDGDERFPE